MTGDGSHTRDPDAIDVAARNDLYPIAKDLEEARLAFLGTEADAGAAFSEAVYTWGGIPMGGWDPLADIRKRWTNVSESVEWILSKSEGRVEDAAESLIETAQSYEDDEESIAADMQDLQGDLN